MLPPKGTYPEYYENYIPLVKQSTVMEALHENKDETLSFFEAIPENMANHAYAEGKWTIKGVLSHIIDTERIFSYLALRFARKDYTQPLPYEQDDYVANAELEKRSLANMVAEFKTVRQASISLFASFSKEALERIGQTAAGKASVNAIGFTICGHSIHHINIVRERYLKNNFAV
ncbi:MAG: DinB family protein [Bacteroidetes bacterium]|nr:DinB family protein [Bacteroidota bacterium]